MVDIDGSGGDRLALAVLAQYRMATTGRLHLRTVPGVWAEQTRRRLMKLRGEGLAERITPAQRACVFGSSPAPHPREA